MQTSGSTDLETCPVSDDLLKKLLDATVNAVTELGTQLPEDQRASLAVYCYRRSHLRPLGLSLAALCSRQALVIEAGHAGELIHAQALMSSAGDREPKVRPKGSKPPVSLYAV